MRLHAYYRSSTSYRLRIGLNLKALAYEVVPVDLMQGEQRGEAFRAVNPYGGVPAIEFEGRCYAQSMAALEWLDERFPEPHALLPAETEERFAVRELAYAIATELHAPLNSPVLAYLQHDLGHSQGEIDAWYHHWLARTLGGVEMQLARRGAGEFLGLEPGLFECVLVPQLYNARRFAFDLADYRHCTRIEAACLELPPFMAAHPDAQPDAPNS
jgi:maleylacetoacetate isomerase